MTLHFGILLVYLAVFGAGFLLLDRHKDFEIKHTKAMMILVLLSAFSLRTMLASRDYAFWYDVGCFKAWANCTTYYGLGNMYHSGIFLDYPPGYMYVLFFTKLIQNFFGIPYESTLYTYIIKLPAIIADIRGSRFIYRLAKEKLGENKALLLGAAFAFCPATIYNSAVWGQIDSFYTLFLMLALYYVYKDSTVKAAAAYAVALITKPQSLLFGPVLLFYILERKSIKEFFKAVGTGLGCMYLFSLPFAQSLSPLWLINLYKNTLGGYKYFTVNGYNLYMLLDMNWKNLSDIVWSGSINVVVIGLCFVLCAVGYAKQKDKSKIFTSALVFITVFFTFCTMMHERYMHPAMLLALMAYILSRKKAYFAMFLGSASCNFLNIVASMRSQYDGFYVSPRLYKTISLLTIAVCLLGLFAYICDTKEGRKFNFSHKTKERIAVVTLTAVYAFFAFFCLGDTKSPQTFYQSQRAGEWFTITFDQISTVKEIRAFSGMGEQYYPENSNTVKKGCDFRVYYRADGEWVHAATFDHDYVFTWKIEEVDFTTDYVLIQANSANQVLNEIVFTDKDGNIIRGTLSMPDSVKNTQYNPYFAVDESETLPADEGYYSSMYFDEIYHGRTAYEQLNGYSIYETTHPPLGKILISIGIAIFGMTPFGWRFMGTLCGVVMVVIMYLLAKELLGKEKIAFLCAFVFAFDFMHFTQTRIATVDSFLTLFIMLMFLFMLKYSKIPLDRDTAQQYIYLLASGIFMGCAIAVKWNGAYGAVGLAVFFFVSLAIKYKACADNIPENRQLAGKQAVLTCLWCVFAFVVLPFAIYFASFAPVFRSEGAAAVIKEFIIYQKNMFSYHSNLEAEHFFSSMWYTWPFILKPIWYSVTRTGDAVSSISAFGNPAVWLPMVLCMVRVLFRTVKNKDKKGFFILTGYLSCYLPWVLVTRLAFIYHYFPATVFGVLAIGYCSKMLLEKSEKSGKYLAVYAAAVFICFMIFFPVISGVPASRTYVDALELLPTWYFN